VPSQPVEEPSASAGCEENQTNVCTVTVWLILVYERISITTASRQSLGCQDALNKSNYAPYHGIFHINTS
jgi:hypothetical protein